MRHNGRDAPLAAVRSSAGNWLAPAQRCRSPTLTRFAVRRRGICIDGGPRPPGICHRIGTSEDADSAVFDVAVLVEADNPLQCFEMGKFLGSVTSGLVE